MFKPALAIIFFLASSFAFANHSVDIEGRNLEYEISGDGDLWVLFDAGALTGMAGWDALWDNLPDGITALRFSRLGEGNSSPCSGQRTSQEHVDEVESVLDALSVKRPFIYVGHSLGGATARNYASTHINDVLGMLLVDPENPRDIEVIKELDPLNGPAQIEQIKANDYKLAEGKWCFLDAIWKKQAAKDFDDIGDIPVTLIASVMQFDKPQTIFNSDAGRKRWGEIQSDWLATFPKGRFVTTDKSPHYIQQSEPELVLTELSLLIEKVKTSLQLADLSGKWRHTSKPAVIQFNMNTKGAMVFQHDEAASAGLNLIKDITKHQSDDKRWIGDMYNAYQDKYVEVSINMLSTNLLSISSRDGKEVLRLKR
jgi:pimeloyl-ACP methyl ester carboxylesterase